MPKYIFPNPIRALFLTLILVIIAQPGNVQGDDGTYITIEYRAKSPSRSFLDSAPFEFQEQFIARRPAPDYKPKTPGHYSRNDWQDIIDATWGEGLPTEDKLSIWQNFWDVIDQQFACFHHLDPTIWDSIDVWYTPEITAGVSRGRFAGILAQASVSLKEAHTKMLNLEVIATEMLPGIPLMKCNGWGNNNHFGVALTPLPDSSLLVYATVPSHPLNLVPGDIVLGYDGIPWKTLYLDLLDAELPIASGFWGCSGPSYLHSWLNGAGLNWHLFDTIDVIRHSTSDTVHLSTIPLAGQAMELWATEQLPVAGVPMPDYYTDQLVSWGIIEGTTIGYIYGIGWWGNVDSQWYNAIDSLMNHYTTTGLIVDFRVNFGGNMWLAYPGLELLFNRTTRTIGFARRCNVIDRVTMCYSSSPTNFQIEGDPGSYYDKPIAVLTGPGAVSSGDQISLAMMFHPMSKAFGKPTNAAFNSPVPAYPHPDFYFRYAPSDAYLASNPYECLTHTEFPSGPDYTGMPFEEVWLTQEGVIEGRDDVVEAALAWIEIADLDGDGVIMERDNCPEIANSDQLDDDDDGLGNACDNCPEMPNTDQVDSDFDGWGDVCDNCPDSANADQEDGDEDGVGNICDNCPDNYNPDQIDTDGDGYGDSCQYICGDANYDQELNIGDAVYVINYIFKGGPAPHRLCEADANGDDEINVGDAVYMINYVFNSGPPPIENCCP